MCVCVSRFAQWSRQIDVNLSLMKSIVNEIEEFYCKTVNDLIISWIKTKIKCFMWNWPQLCFASLSEWILLQTSGAHFMACHFENNIILILPLMLLRLGLLLGITCYPTAAIDAHEIRRSIDRKLCHGAEVIWKSRPLTCLMKRSHFVFVFVFDFYQLWMHFLLFLFHRQFIRWIFTWSITFKCKAKSRELAALIIVRLWLPLSSSLLSPPPPPHCFALPCALALIQCGCRYWYRFHVVAIYLCIHLFIHSTFCRL